MGYFIHAFKTELDLTPEQKQMVSRACGACRFVYNLYLEKQQEACRNAVEKIQPGYHAEVEEIKACNKDRSEEEKKPYPKALKVSVPLTKAGAFYTWLKKEYIVQNPDKAWINEVSSKSVKEAIRDAYRAYDRFFKGQGGFPRFKSKKNSSHSAYFVRPNKDQPVISKRHYVKVPGFGKLHLKEKGYIPVSEEGKTELSSGRVSEKNGRYYISVTVRFPEHKPVQYALKEQGEGIDLGVKDFVTLSDGTRYRNINKDRDMKRKARRLRRLQRSQSRKREAFQKRKKEDAKKNSLIRRFNASLFEEERIPEIRTTSSNLTRNGRRVSRLHESIARKREDYIKKTASQIAGRRPKHITMENLNVKGMMKNRHLARAIGECCFFEFRETLKNLCWKHGIEFRLADRYYPSSKLCSCCGHKNEELKLSDRIWTCPECRKVHDREINAATNLKNTTEYTVLLPNTAERRNTYI